MEKFHATFSAMVTDKKVRITPEFRQYWGDCSGQWFSIFRINSDGTVGLQDQYHTQFLNAPLSAVIL